MEIKGSEAKTLYEFVRAHNIANDGQRLGQRFVSIFCEKPWQALYYEQSDKCSLEIIQNFLTEHHYFDKMPPVPQQKKGD